MAAEGGESLVGGDYSELKDLRISLDRRVVGGGGGDGRGRGFGLCFWLYLKSPVEPSTVILRQMQSDSSNEVSFLSLDKDGKMMLSPLLVWHEEAPTGISVSHANILNASTETEFLKDKWIHVGCEVSMEYVCLHTNGAIVGEKLLSSSSKNLDQDSLGVSLAGNNGGDKKLVAYVHDLQIFPLSSHINFTDLITKSVPMQLSLDCSRVFDGIDECDDGIWSIVGGKVSCRRKFSVDVVLLDAFGHSVHKESKILASLVYADDGTAVKKPYENAEAPLLVYCDGLEYPSSDRTVNLIDGHASIKLKISQLSSKCDNRLFRVHFHSPFAERYPFLEAYSPPIRCISRSCNSRGNPLGTKQSHSPGVNERSHEIQDNSSGMQSSNESDSNCSHPSSKRRRLGFGDSSMRVDVSENSPQGIDGSTSHDFTADGTNVIRKVLEPKFEHHTGTDNVLSDSESTDAKNSVSKKMDDTRKSISGKSISDATIFKYCLEDTEERSLLLREVVASASDEEMMDFAEQVSLYSGCSHHRYQILIAKQLVKEGSDSWRYISHNDNRVLWSDVIPEIDRKFKRISQSSRGLSGQDMEILRKIAGCGDDMAREDFDKMWNWLFPVAFTLSKNNMNALWKSTTPKWIEGIVTKEESESSLRGPRGHPDPGTFILRFPTSRRWPHPDAGCLVVTYVGADYTLHNRLLSIDDREVSSRPLQELLLEEPELSQLGRIKRDVYSIWEG